MAEDVQYIEFDQEGTPRFEVPADFTQDQINEYLKSETVENAMFENGFLFKYGLQPVNMLEAENLDDGSFKSGFKRSYENIKALGQGRMAAFYDFVGNEEKQQEALKIAEQYKLDTAAYAYRYDPETGKVIPRPNTVEDIFANEEQLTAFTRYVKGTMGSAAASSIPTLLLSAFGGAAGFLVGGPVGAAGGASAGAIVSGYMFGLGENYLAQAEETDDPNLAIAMALAIPYAAAERLGIGGVVPSLVKTLGKKNAVNAMKKPGGMLYEIEKAVPGKGIAKVGGELGKGMLKTGSQEALAEAIQETVTTTAGGLEAGKSFEELYMNKDFAKQLGEASAAGFFGGFGFGVFNPALKQIKELGNQRGVKKNIKGAGGTYTLDDYDGSDTNRAIFENTLDPNLKIGSIVTLKGAYEPDIKNKQTPLFGKQPKFKVLGTTIIDDKAQFVLQSRDLEAAVSIIPVDQVNDLTVVTEEGLGGGDRAENFTYTQEAENQQDANKQQSNSFKKNKELLLQTGHINNKTNAEAESFLGGKDKIIDDVVNEIEVQRENQKDSTTDEGPVDFVDNVFKKYDAFSGAPLREAVAKDYNYWLQETLNREADGTVEENKLTKDERKTLDELGYWGERGQSLIDGLVQNTTAQTKTKTEGRARLEEIINSAKTENPIRFNTLSGTQGGPVEVERIIGEKVRTNQPVSAEERASLTGERLINVIKYNPRTYTESSTFEDLYDVPLQTRIRDAVQLAQHLDSQGWKNKAINSKHMKAAIAAHNRTIATAKFQYGVLSKSYKQAVQAKKNFVNQENHILANPFAPAGTFSLIPILSPKAIRQAQRELQNLRADTRSRSTDPNVSGPILQQIEAYQHIIDHTPFARKQLNDLLQSMSLEPITEWETFTLSKLKGSLTSYIKKVNRKRAEVKKTPIKSFITMLQADESGGNNPIRTQASDEIRLAIEYSFRQLLDGLGLPNVDLAVTKSLAGLGAKGAFQKPSKKGEILAQEIIIEKETSLYQTTDLLTQDMRLISVAFDFDAFQTALQKGDKEGAGILLGLARHTLNHEAIHALYEAGAFTETEWQTLTKIAKEKFIPRYLPAGSATRQHYEAKFKEESLAGERGTQTIEDLLVEEAIAMAFADHTIQDVDVFADENKQTENVIAAIFRKLKAILLSLVYGLKSSNLNSPLDIFNNIQAGIVGERIKTENKAVDMAIHKDINKMTLSSFNGDIVMANKIVDSEVNTAIAQEIYTNFLGQIIKPGKFDVDLRFSMDLNKVRWSKNAEAMGGSAILDPYTAMYVPMSAAQYLSLTPYLNFKDTRSTRSITAITKGVAQGKAVAAPMLEIDINSKNNVGRVVSHEGRHRSFVTKTIHGDQTVMPVAMVFKIDGAIIKDNPQGRQDPVNKKIIADFIEKGKLFAQGTFRTEINYKGDTVTADNITSFPEVQRMYPGIQPTVKPSTVINKVFQEYETTDTGDYRFTKEYNNEDNLSIAMFSLGTAADFEGQQNRQENRNTERQITKNVQKDKEIFEGPFANYEKMTAFSKILGHARTWAKNPNTPFYKLYGAVMNRLSKAREIQASMTNLLRRRYLEVKKDPYMAQLLNKAHMISQMTGQRVKKNERGELIFVAPRDSSDKNGTVKQGEMVVLTGDVAGAFADYESVIFALADEFLASEIAREHVPSLLSALDLMRRFFPRLPELQTMFNFEGLTEEEISFRLERLSPEQIRFIHQQVSNIMMMRTSMDGTVAEEVNILLGNQTSGLNKLKTTANIVEGRKQFHYAPLARFGDIYISVKQLVDVKDSKGNVKQIEQLVDYQQFETNAEAQEAYNKLRIKYPNATVSRPAKQTIQNIRSTLRSTEKPPGLECVSQFMSDTNAEKFNAAMKELREVLASKGLDKNVVGINQFFTPRNKEVGLEGVPGYDPDFSRSILQYIAISSQSLARNRFSRDAAKGYTETIEYAVKKGDKNLEKGTKSFYNYEQDPTHEWAGARRMGFWWYLGGNLSSALLQTMSAVQFTGPILSQLGGTTRTLKELGRAFADANAAVYRGTVGKGERQYDDAFLDFSFFEKYKLTEPDLYEALMKAVADGTIKQGQAMQEAGMVEGLSDASMSNKKTIKKIENVLVGGAFNTMESFSRITAFIAAFRLAKGNPNVISKAELLYEGDMDYQRHKDLHGDSPAAFARFMTEETFGVYGKENRPWAGRGFGSLPALFMTYITQMFGLMYRLLNPYVLKIKDGRLSVGLANPNRSKAANAIGRKAFARIALMIGLTGGLMGLPGAEDAEDIINAVRKLQNGGVDSEIRTEFRNMLYDAGWGPKMIEAMEAGLLNTYLNIDVQGRISFGMAPWSRQVRAGLSLAGFQTGAKADEFLGAPGAILIDPIRALVNEGLREGDWGSAGMKFLPTSVRNLTKVAQYTNRGYMQTGYGQVITDDLNGMDLAMQALGFTPTEISKNRELLYLERNLDRAGSGFKKRMNARITNALRDIILGGQRKDADLINDGQSQIR